MFESWSDQLDGATYVAPPWLHPLLTDPRDLDVERTESDVLDDLLATERAKAGLEARSMELVLELHQRVIAAESEQRPALQRGPYQPEPFQLTGDELAPALRISPVTAANRVYRAEDIIVRLPGTFAALQEGRIDLSRALAIHDATKILDSGTASTVEAMVLQHAADQTPGEVRRAAERAVIAADPEAAEKRRQAATRGRRVERSALPDGVGRLDAVLSAIDTGQIYELLDDLARRCKTAGDTRGMDARRADALVQIVLGRDPYLGPEEDDPGSSGWGPRDNEPPRDDGPGDEPPDGEDGPPPPPKPPRLGSEPEPGPEPAPGPAPAPASGTGPRGGRRPDDTPGEATGPTSELMALLLAALAQRRPPRLPWVQISSVRTPSGRRVHVAEMEGHGALTAEVGQHLLDCGVARPPPYETRDLTTWSVAGHDPPEAMAEHVRTRDGTCRFPGCQRAARRCDLDHTVAHPDGPTCPGNLAALCRRHHRTKHHRRWRARLLPDDLLEWTSPAGRVYLTTPRGTTGRWCGTAGPTAGRS